MGLLVARYLLQFRDVRAKNNLTRGAFGAHMLNAVWSFGHATLSCGKFGPWFSPWKNIHKMSRKKINKPLNKFLDELPFPIVKWHLYVFFTPGSA